MPTHNTHDQFGAISKVFHWLTAMLIFTVFPLGIVASRTAHTIKTGGGDQTLIDRAALLFSLHKTVGIAVFLVALLRIFWALRQPKPGLLNGDNQLESYAAELVHYMLYLALVLVPLTGWITHAASEGFAPILWPFGQNLPFVPKDVHMAETLAKTHDIAKTVLLIALLLHIGGAIKHHVIDRDATLRRMWFGTTYGKPTRKQPNHAVPAGIAALIWLCVIGLGISPLMPAQNIATQSPTHQSRQSADAWIVQDGTVALSITQMGSNVTGQFNTWTSDIIFENDAGRVTTEIDIASLTLGSVYDQAMGPDYFDVSQFSKAVFQAHIAKADGGGYVANGTLQIKEITLPVTLPFTLDIQDNTAIMLGELVLNRMDYGIGLSTPDASTLGHEVAVQINLTATR